MNILYTLIFLYLLIGLIDTNAVVIEEIDCKNLNLSNQIDKPQYSKHDNIVKLNWKTTFVNQSLYETCLVKVFITQWNKESYQEFEVFLKTDPQKLRGTFEAESTITFKEDVINMDMEPCLTNWINIGYYFEENIIENKRISIPRNQTFGCTKENDTTGKRKERKGKEVEDSPCEELNSFGMSGGRPLVVKKSFNSLQISWSHLIIGNFECIDQLSLYKMPDTQNPVDHRKIRLEEGDVRRPFNVTLSGDEICWKHKFFVIATNQKVKEGKGGRKSNEGVFVPPINRYYSSNVNNVKMVMTNNSVKVFWLTNLFLNQNYTRCLSEVVLTLNSTTKVVSNAGYVGPDPFEEFEFEPDQNDTLNMAFSFKTSRNGGISKRFKRVPVKENLCKPLVKIATNSSNIFKNEDGSFRWISIGSAIGGGLVLIVLLVVAGFYIKGRVGNRRKERMESVDEMVDLATLQWM